MAGGLHGPGRGQRAVGGRLREPDGPPPPARGRSQPVLQLPGRGRQHRRRGEGLPRDPGGLLVEQLRGNLCAVGP
ncbi:hypothetical protein ACFFX0_03615 [Citricoccus parietis]|uniref:Uncharacterized protein n=1 Tax=Citricoccus parietis TaxID=592307 RepID=A0ABV5FUI0_9MICC